MTEVIFFQAVKAVKSQAVEWNAQIATGYAETALFSGWKVHVPTFLPSPYIRGNFKSSSSMVLYAL